MTDVRGDLIRDRKWAAIAHVINARCIKPHGLSAQVRQLGLGCHYAKRRPMYGRNLAVPGDRPAPGTIDVLGLPTEPPTEPPTPTDIGEGRPPPICIGIVGQLDYGGPNPGRAHRPAGSDTREERLAWFALGLEAACQLLESVGLETLGLPHGVGCGLGGGRWPDYHRLIREAQCRHPTLAIEVVRRGG